MAQLLKMQAHIRGIDQSKKDETAQNLRVMLDNIPTEPDMTQRNDAQDILSAASAAKTVSDVKDKEDKDLGKFAMCVIKSSFIFCYPACRKFGSAARMLPLLCLRDASLRIFVVRGEGRRTCQIGIDDRASSGRSRSVLVHFEKLCLHS